MELSEAAGILKTLRKTCLWRTLKSEKKDEWIEDDDGNFIQRGK